VRALELDIDAERFLQAGDEQLDLLVLREWAGASQEGEEALLIFRHGAGTTASGQLP
jgi:hypothetical protein